MQLSRWLTMLAALIAVAVDPPASPPASRPDEWTIEAEGARIEVRDAVIERRIVTSFFGIEATEAPLLRIRVRVTNIGAGLLDFRSWQGIKDARDPFAAALADERGWPYERRFVVEAAPPDADDDAPDAPKDTPPADAERPAVKLAPHAWFDDTIVFQPPDDAAVTLLLRLPLVNVGGTGERTVRIPTARIERREVPPPPPEPLPPEPESDVPPGPEVVEAPLVPTEPEGPAVLSAVFAERRSETHDVVYAKDGSVLNGTLLTSSLGVRTELGPMTLRTDRCAAIRFPSKRGAPGHVITVNRNQVFGVLMDRTLRFRLASSGDELTLRRDTLLRIVRRRDAAELDFLDGETVSDQLAARDGTVVTGRLSTPVIQLELETGDVTLERASIRHLSVVHAARREVTVTTTTGDRMTGRWKDRSLAFVPAAGDAMDQIAAREITRLVVDGPLLGGGPSHGSFLGLPVEGMRVAFLIDRSGSMTGPRLPRVITALSRTLDEMKAPASVLVAFYSHEVELPRRELSGWISAESDDLRALQKWIQERAPQGGTDPSAAFAHAFAQMPAPDTIIFLTDGHVPDVVVDRLVAQDQGVVPIHVLSLGGDTDPGQLQRLARDTGGAYRRVDLSEPSSNSSTPPAPGAGH